MQNQKDTNLTGNHQGQTSSFSDDNSVKISNDFNVNDISLVKKTEKIVAALYMITDVIDGDEPIKKELRNISIILLSKTHDAGSLGTSEATLYLHEAKNEIGKIRSLLGIAGTIGIISEMNYNLLEKELCDLSIICDKSKCSPKNFTNSQFFNNTRKSSSLILSADIFNNETDKLDEDVKLKGQIRDSKTIGQNNEPLIFKTPKIQTDNNKTYKKALSVGLKMERKNIILKAVKEKKKVTIKDITTLFTDCSEKTIQRELTALVNKGVLKKQGEKRWSRYYI